MGRDDDQARGPLALAAAVAGAAVVLPFVLVVGARLQALGDAATRRATRLADLSDSGPKKKRRKDAARKKGRPELADSLTEMSRKRTKRLRRADKLRSREAAAVDAAGGAR